jgi:pectin methylesterase-like acyl-CoA thioesterase
MSCIHLSLAASLAVGLVLTACGSSPSQDREVGQTQQASSSTCYEVFTTRYGHNYLDDACEHTISTTTYAPSCTPQAGGAPPTCAASVECVPYTNRLANGSKCLNDCECASGVCTSEVCE